MAAPLRQHSVPSSGDSLTVEYIDGSVPSSGDSPAMEYIDDIMVSQRVTA